MSCGAEATFRLLDAFVGWDEQTVTDLIGLADPTGIVLAHEARGLRPTDLARYVPPPRLARGCGPCDWLLLGERRVLVLDGCGSRWRELSIGVALEDPSAIAAFRDRVAISDRDRVIVISRRRGISSQVIDVAGAGPLAFRPHGALFVAIDDRIAVFDLGGRLVETFGAPASVERIAVDLTGSIWIAARDGELLRLHRRGDDGAWGEATLAELARAFDETPISAVSAIGFCLALGGGDGLVHTSCFRWSGRPYEGSVSDEALGIEHAAVGVLETHAIDSGIPRCRWHRVRVDADVPPGTSVSVEVASAESPHDAPDAADWTGSHALDFLVDQPPGRYLFVRLTLRGDGFTTPIVRRVRLDMPRVTSIAHLPEVYRHDRDAEDFTERFLALFDAVIADLDAAIESAPALLDPGGVPDDVLPWIGALIGISFDPTWDPERRRRILEAAPELYRRRGTVGGLVLAIRLATGAEPLVRELAAERAYGALSRGARVDEVRLFGARESRTRLGRSVLGGSPLRTWGSVDRDAVSEGAWTIEVSAPPIDDLTPAELERQIRAIVEALKPAHVLARVRVSSGRMTLGRGITVGVDTVLGGHSPSVIGAAGNVRLGRSSVLSPARLDA